MKKVVIAVILLCGCSFVRHVHAAVIIREQTDGSVSANVGTGCDNACSNVAVGSQVFVPAASANLGSLEIFTSGFSTQSKNPESNSCYLNLYDEDAGVFIASSDNAFNGGGCAGDLVFAFNASQPFLKAGAHYRWDYVFGAQNFSAVTFFGSPSNSVGGVFSASPVLNAKFAAYGLIAPVAALSQSDGANMIGAGTVIKGSSVVLQGMLASTASDTLRFEVELEPSYAAFKNRANLLSGFTSAGIFASVVTSSLLNGGYHWQARSTDPRGNASPWQTPSNPGINPDFAVRDPSSDVILNDSQTGYALDTRPNACLGDGSIFSCPLSPAFNSYAVGAPFSISKITFDWRNNGSNNCDGLGNYGAIITSASDPRAILATSTGAIYMGCAGSGLGAGGQGEFDFLGQMIPDNFYLTFGAFDGILQGGSNVSVSNVVIYSSRGKEPVVIVPGIMGSSLYDASSGIQAWPNISRMIFSGSDAYLDSLAFSSSGISTANLGAHDILRDAAGILHFYDHLIEELQSSGYKEGSTLFAAPYDWRRDIVSSAREIAPILARAASSSPTGRINVIAHSMGGLVMKEYLKSVSGSLVNKLILAGVPQLGAPQALKLLKYGDDLGLNFFGVGLNPEEIKKIGANMPGIYDLLPTRRYIDVNGGYVKDMRSGGTGALSYEQTSAFAPNRALISSADLRHAALDSTRFGIDPSMVYNILGCRKDTIGEIRIYDGEKYGIGVVNGDGIVPLTSPFNLADGYRNFFDIAEDHVGLIQGNEAVGLIKHILSGDASFTAGHISSALSDCLSAAIPRETFLLSLRGPGDLHIYDAAGRRLGPNASSSVLDEEISGGKYFGFGENSFALFPASASSSYHVILEARASGAFDFAIEKLNDGIPKKKATYISIPFQRVGAKADFDLSLFGASPEIRMQTDGSRGFTAVYKPSAILEEAASGDIVPPLLSPPIIPSQMPFGSEKILHFGATDALSGVATTSATLNGRKVFPGERIVFDHVGANIFHLFAEDNAGNPSMKEVVFTVTPPPRSSPPTRRSVERKEKKIFLDSPRAAGRRWFFDTPGDMIKKE